MEGFAVFSKPFRSPTVLSLRATERYLEISPFGSYPLGKFANLWVLLNRCHSVVSTCEFFFTQRDVQIFVTSRAQGDGLVQLFASVSLFETVVLVLGTRDEVVLG